MKRSHRGGGHTPQFSPRDPPKTHRSVFAELAERGEGLLVGFAHLLDELLHLGRDDVALRALRLGHVLLLLVPVIADGCGDNAVSVTGPAATQPLSPQGGMRTLPPATVTNGQQSFTISPSSQVLRGDLG